MISICSMKLHFRVLTWTEFIIRQHSLSKVSWGLKLWIITLVLGLSFLTECDGVCLCVCVHVCGAD